jgi:hypothetical protein
MLRYRIESYRVFKRLSPVFSASLSEMEANLG